MYSTEKLAETIRARRIAAGLTQKEVAEKLFVRPQTVSKWENGVAEPELETLCKLAEILDTEPAYFLRGAIPREDVYLGVDGGGTKTEFLLCTLDGSERGHLILPGSNPTLVGIEETQKRILEGVRTLVGPDMRLRAVFCGMAGCSQQYRREAVTSFLTSALPGTRVQVEGDIANVFACSGVEGDAVAVICGTGSIAFARHGTELHRFGGWGRTFDCFGSGYDIGREVLRCALAVRDGFGRKSRMTEQAREKCGDEFTVLGTQEGQSTAFVASFAPLAFEAYDAHDEDAVRILRENMGYLAGIIGHAQKVCAPGAPVILSGGLTARKDILLPLLEEMCKPCTRFVLPAEKQVVGAWRRAVKLAD